MNINPKLIHTGLALYCIAIFALSSIPGDNFPEVDFKLSDKIVHVIIYSILYILFFYSLKNQRKNVKLHEHSFEFALLFTALYGLTDEIHQYFVPARSCEIYDWFADIAGATIVYAVMKFNLFRIRNLSLILICVVAGGCSSSGGNLQKETVKYSFTELDTWLNLMPVTGEQDNVLGFLLSMNLETENNPDNFEIKNLKIFLNNDTVANKKFKVEKYGTADRTLKINITQSPDEMYLDKSLDWPETAGFEFSLYQNSKKIKTIKTPNLKILKVY
ncbi:MAG: VanZ family protein [Ignavibacteria bacterium]|nr:VanZ family protein [Ignavibacteria bacterium]